MTNDLQVSKQQVVGKFNDLLSRFRGHHILIVGKLKLIHLTTIYIRSKNKQSQVLAPFFFWKLQGMWLLSYVVGGFYAVDQQGI